MNRTTKERLGLLKPIDHAALRRGRTDRKRARKAAAQVVFARPAPVPQFRKPPRTKRKQEKRKAAVEGFTQQNAKHLAEVPESTR